MLCHLLTKLELTALASMAQRLTDDKVFQWVIRTGKQRSTKGAGCTAWMEGNKWHVNLVRSVLGRWRLGKQSRWNDNIKVDLRGKSWGNDVSGIG